MLAAKLGGISRRALLSITLAATIIVALGTYSLQEARITSLSTDLADKSRTIESQSQEIQQYTAEIARQELELQGKVAQLQDLNLRIEALATEIAAKDAQVNDLYATVDTQKRELQALRSEAASLQREIMVLEDQVRSGEQRVSELTNQVSLTQKQLDSAKRVQVKHYGLGVSQDNAGVVFPIEVEIIGAGDGRISVDVGNVQYEASFQTAVRTAAAVASEYTGVSTEDKDIIVKFINDDENDIITVDGPSAGALITGMIIAGLTDRQIQPSVLITGAIEPDGKIGAVGSIMAKADAAVNFGATLMLVPESQQFQSEEIQVVGVSDIEEVVDYLIKP